MRAVKYTTEQTELKERVIYLTQGFEDSEQAKTDVDEFIWRMKKTPARPGTHS